MNISREFHAHTGNYVPGGNSCQYIVIHYTGAAGSARNTAQWSQNDRHNSSFHYVLDGSECFQILEDTDTAWAVGAWKGTKAYVKNNQSISIEVCSSGEPFTAAEIAMLCELVPALMAKHGIAADHVVRHYDCHSGHKECPAPYVDSAAWSALHAQITSGKAQASKPASSKTSSSKTSSKKAASKKVTVKDAQKWLNSNYSTGLAVDDIYGPATKRGAIKALQTELNRQFGKGLSVDGIAGPKTRNAMVNVRKGAKGKLTGVLQCLLVCHGYGIAIDEVFGAETDSAVRSFQRSNGLSVDGIAGRNTWSKLVA